MACLIYWSNKFSGFLNKFFLSFSFFFSLHVSLVLGSHVLSRGTPEPIFIKSCPHFNPLIFQEHLLPSVKAFHAGILDTKRDNWEYFSLSVIHIQPTIKETW